MKVYIFLDFQFMFFTTRIRPSYSVSKPIFLIDLPSFPQSFFSQQIYISRLPLVNDYLTSDPCVLPSCLTVYNFVCREYFFNCCLIYWLLFWSRRRYPCVVVENFISATSVLFFSPSGHVPLTSGVLGRLSFYEISYEPLLLFHFLSTHRLFLVWRLGTNYKISAECLLIKNVCGLIFVGSQTCIAFTGTQLITYSWFNYYW